jgi:hypothetical protein
MQILFKKKNYVFFIEDLLASVEAAYHLYANDMPSVVFIPCSALTWYQVWSES